jgi:predicted O-methyltransferase YrrM
LVGQSTEVKLSGLRIRDSIMTVSTVWGRAFIDALVAPRRFRKVMPELRKLSDMLHHPGVRSFEVGDLPSLPAPIQMLSTPPGYGGMPAQDLYALLRIVCWIKPRKIFEIGTFQGVTTAHMALNSQAEIYTLDLPRDMATNLGGYTANDAALLQARDQIGRAYRSFNTNGRIHQLFGDSRTFDYKEYYGSVDLVLVDACHLYDYVMSDSRHALQLLGKKGVVLWHDFGNSRDVVRAAQHIARELPVYHLEGTNIAFYVRGITLVAQRPEAGNESTVERVA